MQFDRGKIQQVLIQSWSHNTAKQWRSDNPALGQCNVTALLIHSEFGGEILKTDIPGGAHYYNRINGVRVDFTASQFAEPIHYDDITASPEEVATGATAEEQRYLKEAFGKFY